MLNYRNAKLGCPENLSEGSQRKPKVLKVIFVPVEKDEAL